MEGLWINQDAPDRRFDMTRNVRQAVAYALDRERIAEIALGTITADPPVCSARDGTPGSALGAKTTSRVTPRMRPRLPSCSRRRVGRAQTPTACG